MTDVATIVPIDRDEMVGLATREYERLLDVIGGLGDDDWRAPTACDDWDVRLMVAHLVGAAEANASVVESLRQLVRGTAWSRKHDRPQIDGINAVQVADREHLGPDALIDRLRTVAPKAVRGRHRTPGLVRRIPMDDTVGGTMTMGHLVDRVYTRDQWMHRIDISRAVGADLVVTPDHDGRIVEDVVAEWATAYGRPFVLELAGPAGGIYTSGHDGEHVRYDAIDFCLMISGRAPNDHGLPLIVF